MGWKTNHKRIKPRYNPVPNAAEARHKERVRALPCFGCGVFGVSAHHTLLTFPGKRWRRDHRCLLPVCWECHQGPDGIHGIGNEVEWLKSVERTEAEAVEYIKRLWAISEDEERKAA